MTYRARVKNYRAIKSADIHFDNCIALVAGRNEDGKTSLAEAMGAALTGNPIVVRPEMDGKVHQHSAKGLVHDGAEEALVVVAGNNDDAIRVQWPGCEITSRGKCPPSSTNLAAGISGASFFEITPDERLTIMFEILKAAPTRADFDKILKPNLVPDILDRIWSAVEEHGWDACWSKAREKARDLKGEFRSADVAGVAWGKEKALKWRPEGWLDIWEMEEVEFFQQAVETARKAVEAAIANKAVDESGIEQDRETAAGLDDIQAGIAAAQDEYGKHNAEVARLESEIGKIVTEYHVLTCPECSSSLALLDGELTKAKKPPTDATINKRILKREELQTELAAATEARDKQTKTIALQKTELTAASTARERVEEFDAKSHDGTTTADDIEKLRATEAEATNNMSLIMRLNRAQKIHAAITQNLNIADALSPNGIRGLILADKLTKFNQQLNEHGGRFGMPEVVLHADMTITCGKRAYHLLSESSKFRIRTLLQFCIALDDGSHIIVIDNDVDMDRKWYLGLCRMIFATGKPTLICARFETAKDVPVLDKAPMGAAVFGRSYWIEDGVTRLLGDPVEEAKAEE